MSTIQRSTSAFSCSSTASSITSAPSKLTKSAAEIPFVRKRLLHEQTLALLAAFEQRTHPSKEERALLAVQLGLELKTVSAWFQNKRRSIKRRSLMWKKENLRENAYGGPLAVRTVGGSRKMSCQGSGISLDSIASSRELPGNCLGGIPERPPLTPRRINMKKIVVSPTKPMVNLWEHIPSSPPAPPSSPSADSLRFATLPTHSKKTRSLEWACAKARAERNPKDQDADNDFDVPMLILDGAAKHPDTDAGGDDTETEDLPSECT